MPIDPGLYRALMGEPLDGFRPGERYRLGLGLVRGQWEADSWTGAELVLGGEVEHELWWAWCNGEKIVVNAARLRAAAFLGKDEDGNGSAGEARNGGDPDGRHDEGSGGD